MVASTGVLASVTQPKVVPASVSDGEGGDGADQAFHVVHQEEEREDEQQVIEAEDEVRWRPPRAVAAMAFS